MKINDEISGLFRKVRTTMGAGIRPIQLTDEMLCDLLEMCVEDYAEKVQSWMVETQWMSLYGKNITTTDMAHALSVRTFDMAKDYSYWFSKEVGLQQRGGWELKKDFITIEKGKQNYLIPAGREINKVLYMNPPSSIAALFAGYGGTMNVGMGIGAQVGGGGMGMGALMGGMYMAPASDISYLATDVAYKNRLIRGDFVYKVTGGPNGTKILHLMSTPGSTLTFGGSGQIGNGIGVVGCEVWYTYYDINSDDELDDCRRQNPDLLITPDQVPLNKMDYAFLNEPTKTIVRQLLVAKAKETLGIVRGTNSGKVSFFDAELQMDYQMLLTQGQQEWLKTMDALEKRLERMHPTYMMEQQAKLVQSTLEVLKGTPLGIITI